MSNQFGDTRIDDDLTLLSETLEGCSAPLAIPPIRNMLS